MLLLGALGVPLWCFWAPLGSSEAPLGCSWGLLAVPLGALWAPFASCGADQWVNGSTGRRVNGSTESGSVAGSGAQPLLVIIIIMIIIKEIAIEKIIIIITISQPPE